MKKKHKFACFIFAVLFTLPSSLSSSQTAIIESGVKKYVSFLDLAERFHLQSSFDLISQKGKLYHQNHFAVFHVDYSLFVIDGKLYRTEYAVTRQKGEVLIPLDAAVEMLKKFFGASEINAQGGFLQADAGHVNKDTGTPVKNEIKVNPDDRIGFIIIDPGHGGRDPGAIGKKNIHEKRITLSIAKLLMAKLKKQLQGISILMTRNDDTFIPLSQRTDIANGHLKKKSNGIFISIHVNASLSAKISGYETYFLSQNPSNEEARNTAALENYVVVLEDKKEGEKGYGDIDYIEAMMLTTQIQKESSLLADCIQGGIAKKVREFKSRNVKKADFFVLRGALMPAALVEVGYITNKQEASYLQKSWYQKKVADGIVYGVMMFIEKYNRMVRKKN